MSRVATAELWQLDRVIGGALIFVAVKEWLASLMFVFCHILRMCFFQQKTRSDNARSSYFGAQHQSSGLSRAQVQIGKTNGRY